MPADKAASLSEKLLRALDRLAARRAVPMSECVATLGDLEDLIGFQGRSIPRSERCPKDLYWHIQRAFLFNAAGYSCQYCGRTAWDS